MNDEEMQELKDIVKAYRYQRDAIEEEYRAAQKRIAQLEKKLRKIETILHENT